MDSSKFYSYVFAGIEIMFPVECRNFEREKQNYNRSPKYSGENV